MKKPSEWNAFVWIRLKDHRFGGVRKHLDALLEQGKLKEWYHDDRMVQVTKTPWYGKHREECK